MIEPPQSASTSSDHFYIIVAGIVAVLVVLIPALVTLITLYRRGTRTASDVAEVKDQVKNDHKTNLREEADGRHEENSKKLEENGQKMDRVIVMMTGLASTVQDVQQDVRELKITVSGHTEQIDEIEHTQDRAKIDKGPRH